MGEQALGNAINWHPMYREIYSAHINEGVDDRSIDDAFYEREVRMLELAFEGQMHFGIYYAFVKLKEQEVRNLVWISECMCSSRRTRSTSSCRASRSLRHGGPRLSLLSI